MAKEKGPREGSKSFFGKAKKSALPKIMKLPDQHYTAIKKKLVGNKIRVIIKGADSKYYMTLKGRGGEKDPDLPPLDIEDTIPDPEIPDDIPVPDSVLDKRADAVEDLMNDAIQEVFDAPPKQPYVVVDKKRQGNIINCTMKGQTDGKLYGAIKQVGIPIPSKKDWPVTDSVSDPTVDYKPPKELKKKKEKVTSDELDALLDTKLEKIFK